MKGFVLILTALVIFAAAACTQAMVAKDTIKVLNETTGLPVEVVSITVAHGDWFDKQFVTYKTAVIVGIRVTSMLNASDIQMNADYIDSLNGKITDINKTALIDSPKINEPPTECNLCNGGLLPIDLSPHYFQDARGPRHLVLGQTYYASFLFPASLTYNGGEINHISIEVNNSDSVSKGGIWIYHTSGDVPERGASWAPRGIRPDDGYSQITHGNDDNWTISS